MIIKVDDKVVSKILDVCEENGVVAQLFDNEYFATCKEEIYQAIDCSDSFNEDETFYDSLGDKAEDIAYEMADELYNSKEADQAFQVLAEAAQLIVNHKIYKLKSEKDILEDK